MAKDYIKWSAKLVKTKYWEMMNVSISLENLQRLPQNKWYVKFTIAERREIDQYGNTHCIFENNYVWNPDNTPDEGKDNLPSDDEELPF